MFKVSEDLARCQMYLSKFLNSHRKWSYYIGNYNLCVPQISFFFSHKKYIWGQTTLPWNKKQSCHFRTGAGREYYTKREFLEKLEIDLSHWISYWGGQSVEFCPCCLPPKLFQKHNWYLCFHSLTSELTFTYSQADAPETLVCHIAHYFPKAEDFDQMALHQWENVSSQHSPQWTPSDTSHFNILMPACYKLLLFSMKATLGQCSGSQFKLFAQPGMLFPHSPIWELLLTL